jgi:hypothetical protein
MHHVAMPAGQPWTGDDADHNTECHQRWASRRNWDVDAAAFSYEWYWEQCGGCRYWIPLHGQIGSDYGACTHAESAFDGQVRFEHDRCDQFAVRADRSFG